MGEIVSLNSLVQPGLCGLLYGPMDVGKTDALLTLPDKLHIISTEPKDIYRTIKEHMKRNGQTDRKIMVDKIIVKPVKSEDEAKLVFDEILEILNNIYIRLESNRKKGDPNYIRSLGFDSLSFTQTLFKMDMEDSRFEDRLEEGKRDDTYIDKFRMERPDWGGLQSSMIRLTNVLNNISKFGVYVFATAISTEKVKWDRTMEAAPYFEGGYASINAGYFDIVGFVQPGNDKNYPYPPTINFVGEDFVTRCCSDRLKKKGKGVLNLGKIIKAIEE